MKYITWLYDTVFPVLGEIFGKITALAMTEWQTAFRFVLADLNAPAIQFTNYFTGVTSTFESLYTLGDGGLTWHTVLLAIREFSLSAMSFLPKEVPFCFAIVLFFMISGMAISILKFLIGLFR